MSVSQSLSRISINFVYSDFIKTDSTNGILHCYFCQDTFENVYDPYTDCQTNVSNVPVDTCLDTNKFCMVSPLAPFRCISYIKICA